MMAAHALAVYGAGGLGREVLELARIINEKESRWNNLFFIDDGKTPGQVNGVSVYSYAEAKQRFGMSFEIVIGIGEPAVRRKLVRKVTEDGYVLPNLVHPDVHIPSSTKLGMGIVIQYGCFVSCNVTVGNYVYLQPQCNIGHDDVLEEGCMISGLVNLAGAVRVGKYSYIGISSAVRELVKIGNDAVVGMGTFVQRDIPDGSMVMGYPGRIMGKGNELKVFKASKNETAD